MFFFLFYSATNPISSNDNEKLVFSSEIRFVLLAAYTHHVSWMAAAFALSEDRFWANLRNEQNAEWKHEKSLMRRWEKWFTSHICCFLFCRNRLSFPNYVCIRSWISLSACLNRISLNSMLSENEIQFAIRFCQSGFSRCESNDRLKVQTSWTKNDKINLWSFESIQNYPMNRRNEFAHAEYGKVHKLSDRQNKRFNSAVGELCARRSSPLPHKMTKSNSSVFVSIQFIFLFAYFLCDFRIIQTESYVNAFFGFKSDSKVFLLLCEQFSKLVSARETPETNKWSETMCAMVIIVQEQRNEKRSEKERNENAYAFNKRTLKNGIC